MLPATLLRKAPIQPPCQPAMTRLPPIVMSLTGKLTPTAEGPGPPPIETTLWVTLTAVRYIVCGADARMLPRTVSLVVVKPQGGIGGGPLAPGAHPRASVAPRSTRTLWPTCTVPRLNASRHAPGAMVRVP